MILVRDKIRKEALKNAGDVLFVHIKRSDEGRKRKKMIDRDKKGEGGQGLTLKVKRTGYTLRIHTMNCQGDSNNASEFFLSVSLVCKNRRLNKWGICITI